MIIEVMVEREDKKGDFNKAIYEFDHVFPRLGVWGWVDGLRAVFDFSEDPKLLCVLPDKMLTTPEDGKITKFVECYKTLKTSEAPYVITYIGDMYVMEKGKTADKF